MVTLDHTSSVVILSEAAVREAKGCAVEGSLCECSESDLIRSSHDSARAWGELPETPLSGSAGTGSLRLRSCFASRTSDCAQDDNAVGNATEVYFFFATCSVGAIIDLRTGTIAP